MNENTSNKKTTESLKTINQKIEDLKLMLQNKENCRKFSKKLTDYIKSNGSF